MYLNLLLFVPKTLNWIEKDHQFLVRREETDAKDWTLSAMDLRLLLHKMYAASAPHCLSVRNYRADFYYICQSIYLDGAIVVSE